MPWISVQWQNFISSEHHRNMETVTTKMFKIKNGFSPEIIATEIIVRETRVLLQFQAVK